MTSRPLALRRRAGLQHGVGLADAGRRAEEDLEPAASFPVGQGEQRIRRGTRRLGQGHDGLCLRRSGYITPSLGAQPVEGPVNVQDVDPRFPEDP